MAENPSICFLDAMDELWFRQSILALETPEFTLKAMLKKKGTIAAPPPQLATKLSSNTVPGESSAPKSDAEDKRIREVYKQKKPVLNIDIHKPLFQLQPPTKSKIYSHPSSPSSNADSERKFNRRRKPSKMRNYKSLSDLENYELKGFMDLGFVFHEEELSPEMMSMIPGLQRLVEDKKGGEHRREISEEQVKRPYLSEAWDISRPDSPLLNLRVLPKTPEEGDIKKHLRFWARKVASLIQEDC